jgi:S-methylmethionine-dependent homocysteine/selenocysteine methylase
MVHIGAPGLESRHIDLTRRAVELALAARKQTGRSQAAIAGVIGPLEHCFRPDLSPHHDTARAEHNELAETLVESGVDLLLLCSMNTLHETRAAIEAARLTGLPFWVSFVLGPEGELLSKEPLREAVYLARRMGADAVLVDNVPPAAGAAVLKQLEAGGPAGLLPHLGRYDPPSWKFEFFPRFTQTDEWPPERLAQDAHGWTHAGARIVGPGFGGGPDHVRALVAIQGATA